VLDLLNRHSTEMLDMVQQIEEARSHISDPHAALGPMFDELAKVVSDHVENLEDWAAVLREPAPRGQRRHLHTN
jgi:protein-tyrosine-phosphatase